MYPTVYATFSCDRLPCRNVVKESHNVGGWGGVRRMYRYFVLIGAIQLWYLIIKLTFRIFMNVMMLCTHYGIP